MCGCKNDFARKGSYIDVTKVLFTRLLQCCLSSWLGSFSLLTQEGAAQPFANKWPMMMMRMMTMTMIMIIIMMIMGNPSFLAKKDQIYKEVKAGKV